MTELRPYQQYMRTGFRCSLTEKPDFEMQTNRNGKCNHFNRQVILKENVNVMKKCIWIVGFLLLMVSCERSVVDVSINEVVKQNQYYTNEIFATQNLKVYGTWQLLYTTGGLAGSTTKPTSDFHLEFLPFGIYGIINDNQVTEIGKIGIIKQESSLIVINFTPDDDAKTNYSFIQKSINFMGNDTLVLCDYNMSDGYNNYYKRIK